MLCALHLWLMEYEVRDGFVDAVADETIHLRAELNAVRAELQMMREELQRIALAAGLAPSPLTSDPLHLPRPVILDGSSGLSLGPGVSRGAVGEAGVSTLRLTRGSACSRVEDLSAVRFVTD